MKHVTVIGGMNVDVLGNPYGQINHGEHNEGTLSMSFSGTGFNICRNLSHLGLGVSFVSIAGNDFPGKAGKQQLEQMGVNIENVKLDESGNTPTRLEIRNIVNDLEMSFGNSDILDNMNKVFLEGAMSQMKQSDIVAIDANLPEDSLKYMADTLKDTPIFFDPANAEKAIRARKVIGKFHTITPNREEAERISGLEILNEDQLMEAGKWFCDAGVKKIFITLNGGGTYYKEGNNEGIVLPREGINIINELGVGDAFSAAVIYGNIQGMSIEGIADYAMKAAEVTLATKYSVEEHIKRRLENE